MKHFLSLMSPFVFLRLHFFPVLSHFTSFTWLFFFPSLSSLLFSLFLLCHFLSLLLSPSLSSAGQEDYRTRLSGECFQDLVCPEKCRCEGTVVDCSNLKLTRIPPHIPDHTTDL